MTQTECQNFFFFFKCAVRVATVHHWCRPTEGTMCTNIYIQQVQQDTASIWWYKLPQWQAVLHFLHPFLSLLQQKKKKKRIKLTVLCLCRSQHPLYLQYTSRFWNQAPECWASIYPVQQPVKHTHFGTLFIIRTFHRQKMFLQCF